MKNNMHYWEEEYFDSDYDEKQEILRKLAEEEYYKKQHEWDINRLTKDTKVHVSWTNVNKMIKCRYGDNFEEGYKTNDTRSKQPA